MKYFTLSGLRWLWVSVVIFALDRISKFLILKYFTPYEPLYINPFFNLMLAFNKGAAFSFLNSASGWQSWLFSGLAVFVSVFILLRLTKMSHSQRWLGIAFALVIGGALGNLYDRIAIGHVVDFIQLHVSGFYWPIFNVADSAICIGAVMLFIEIAFWQKK